MASVRLQFVMGRGWSSRIIGWLGMDAGHGFSHVDVVLPSGHLLGARLDAVGGKPSGVQVRPPGYERWLRRVVLDIPCDATQATTFYAWAREQVGKPYDREAIIGFVVDRDWRDDSAWFCSELATWLGEKAGILKPLFAPFNKIHPTECAILYSAVGGHTVELEGAA